MLRDDFTCAIRRPHASALQPYRLQQYLGDLILRRLHQRRDNVAHWKGHKGEQRVHFDWRPQNAVHDSGFDGDVLPHQRIVERVEVRRRRVLGRSRVEAVADCIRRWTQCRWRHSLVEDQFVDTGSIVFAEVVPFPTVTMDGIGKGVADSCKRARYLSDPMSANQIGDRVHHRGGESPHVIADGRIAAPDHEQIPVEE